MMALAGKRVLVPRAEGQAHTTAELLRARGAEPVMVPLIAFAPADPAPIAAALARLERGEYGVVVFTSENGVRAFFEALEARSLDTRALGKARIAVVGTGTRDALLRHEVRAHVVAKESRGEGLAAAILEVLGDARPPILLARAREAREVLPETLRAAGCEVDVVPVYVTVPVADAAEHVHRALTTGIDAVLFTSASTVDRFADALGDVTLAPAVVVASIGPVTSEAAKRRGFTVQVEAATQSMAALVDALESAVRAPT